MNEYISIEAGKPAALLLDFGDVRWHSDHARLGEIRVDFNQTTVELELLNLEVTKTKEDANDCATKDYCSPDCKFFEDCFPEAVREPEPEREPGRDDDLDGDPDEPFGEYHDCSIHCWI